MDTKRLNLAVIVGSIRNGRTGPQIAEWFMEHARVHMAFEAEIIDPAETPLPAALPNSPEALKENTGRSTEMIALKDRLVQADAFVLVTPEYDHGVPASVKQLIDWHVLEWRHMPMSFASYGDRRAVSAPSNICGR